MQGLRAWTGPAELLSRFNWEVEASNLRRLLGTQDHHRRSSHRSIGAGFPLSATDGPPHSDRLSSRTDFVG